MTTQPTYIPITAQPGGTNYNLAIGISEWKLLAIEQVNLVCDSTLGAINIQLPRIQDLRGMLGLTFIIDDVAGTAGTNPITILAGAGDNINFNAASFVINANYGKVRIGQTRNNQSTTVGNWVGLHPVLFSVGNLNPLFTVALTGSPLMPTLAFNAISQAQGLVYASPAVGAGVPSFRALAASDLPGGGGTGTVTSVSSGNFSPLFTTNVATNTTTPALSFTAVNQNANLVYAGPTGGGAAAPTFRALVTADLPAGAGTVSNFTAGDMNPLFETDVANPTTAPALTFTLFAQEANTVFAGPLSGPAPGVPGFRDLVGDDLPIFFASSGPSLSLSPNDYLAITLNGTAYKIALALA